MNSQHHNSVLLVRFLFALVICATVLTLLIRGMSNSARVRPAFIQDEEKSLDIERYPNEPLELVDVRIRNNSVKKEIKFKSKDDRSKWGLDNVRFKEKDDWFKNVRIRLRNVSGNTIYGISVSLFLKDMSKRMIFGISLEPKNRNLKKHPLEKDEEADFEVKEESLNEAMSLMLQYAVDPLRTPVSLSVDSAVFGDNLLWRRGSLLRRNENNPGRWAAATPALLVPVG
jgi:hypothetical protein